MERKDIEEKYTWDLSKIYQDPQEFYHDIEVSQQLLDELTSFKGKMTESVDILLRFLSKRDEMSMLVSKAYCFAHLNCDVEPKEQEYQKMLATVMSLIQQSSVKLVFVDNEIVENDETVREYLKDDERMYETKNSSNLWGKHQRFLTIGGTCMYGSSGCSNCKIHEGRIICCRFT